MTLEKASQAESSKRTKAEFLGENDRDSKHVPQWSSNRTWPQGIQPRTQPEPRVHIGGQNPSPTYQRQRSCLNSKERVLRPQRPDKEGGERRGADFLGKHPQGWKLEVTPDNDQNPGILPLEISHMTSYTYSRRGHSQSLTVLRCRVWSPYGDAQDRARLSSAPDA